MELNIDAEFKNYLIPLKPEEYKMLEKSIIEEGCREPIVVWNNTIVDGHNRYAICQQHGIPFQIKEKHFNDRNEAIEWIIQNQLARRNLTLDEFKLLIGRLYNRMKQQHGGDRKSQKHDAESSDQFEHLKTPQQPAPSIKTDQRIAEKFGVSPATVRRAEKLYLMTQERPEVFDIARQKNKSISAVYRELKLQDEIKRQERAIKEDDVLKPAGKYDVIVVDPPWPYDHAKYDAQYYRGAPPYPVMELSEIEALQLPAKDDSVLFLWTTQKYIWDAKKIMDAWGFKYKAIIVWDKVKMGLGKLLRLQCEFCLVGVKGHPLFKSHKITDIIREPRREHSRKPEAFYKLVDDWCVGRKLDAFGREKRDGWDVWGVEKDFGDSK